VVYQVNGSRVEWDPVAARLRELTEEMPDASVAELGNVNASSRGQAIIQTACERVAALQDAHIAAYRMVVDRVG
jgi:hypothetical protein